jgi:NAD(P)-dependent dehydrogenase (short-subunit alcohol dehydrogenase family)
MKVWLVTGGARGLGRSIVEAAVAAGDQVVVTARDPGQLERMRAQHGEGLRTFILDVTDAKAAQAAVDFTIMTYGRLDVMVNNAGSGLVVAFEQTTEADFRAQVDATFYGVVHLTRAALPAMRRQRSGYIINISLIGGRISTPGLAAYQAAKWAVGGFTEMLAKESSAFGVKIVAVEPGGMRTGWGIGATHNAPKSLSDYEPSVGAMIGVIRGSIGFEAVDPAKVADVIVGLTRQDKLLAHLVLGRHALRLCREADAVRQAEAAEWAAISASTDF